MNTDPDQSAFREVVAVFETAETLQEAIDALLLSGFDRAQLSLLAGEHAVEEKLGHHYSKVEELEDDPEVPRAAYISTESIGDAEGALVGVPMYIAACTAAGVAIAVGGPISAAILAAALAGGAGAAVGGVLAAFVGQHHADYLQEQLSHGGLLLWVRTANDEQETQAKDILSKHSAHDVHAHG